MKIAISTLFFYKPELSKKFMDSILPTLELHTRAHPTDTVDFIVADNTPETASILKDIKPLLNSSNVRLHLHRNDYNKGFGLAHNENFKKIPSDIFIVLNNDLFIQPSDWIERLCSPFKNEKTSLVGVSSSPRILTAAGEGTWGKKNFDYAEGSILAVRSSVAEKYGLFATDLEIAYYEDSDLSLRYRQMGLEIDFVDIPHEHHRGSSSEQIPKDLLESIRLRNQTRFFARWKRYLKTRKFENRIFLDLAGGGWGDVVAAIPTVIGLLRDHPTAEIEIQTNQVGLAPLLSFPRVNVRTTGLVGVEEIRNKSKRFDRIFSLLDVDFSSVLNLGEQIALDAGVHFDLGAAREAVSKQLQPSQNPLVLNAIESGKPICVLHTESLRETWEGRSPESKFFRASVSLLKERGYHVVLVGGGNSAKEVADLCSLDLTGKTSHEDLFSLIKAAKLFVGMDSGPLHVAQLFNIPSFVVFGATLPTARIINLENSYGYVREDLNCIGCYHEMKPSPNNYCIRRDQACVKLLDEKVIAANLGKFLDGTLKWDFKTIQREQKAIETKQILWAKSSLPQMTALSKARLRDLISALMAKFVRMFVDRF